MPIPAPINTKLRVPLSSLKSPVTPLGFQRTYSKAEGLLSPLSSTLSKAGIDSAGGFAIASVANWGLTPKPTPTTLAFEVSGRQNLDSETPVHGEYFFESDKQLLLTRRPLDVIPLPPASPFERVAAALDAQDGLTPLDFGPGDGWSSPDLFPQARENGEIYWVSSSGFMDLSDLEYDSSDSDNDSDLSSSVLFAPVRETRLDLGSTEANPPTLRSTFESQIPATLLSVLSKSQIHFDVYTEKLSVLIFSDATKAVPVDAGQTDVWLANNCVFDLSVTVAHSVNGYEHLEEMELVLQFVSWLLEWVRANHNQTIEQIDIAMPEDFVLSTKALNAAVIKSGSANSLLNLHTLSCSGNVNILAALVASLDAKNVQILKINSDISVDDASLLLRKYPGSKLSLHTLELASVSDCVPTLLPLYEGKDVSATEILPPLTLPTLDSLKVVGSVDLIPFFDALSLPNLCKLELDIQADLDGPAQALLSLPIVWTNLGFLDVQFNGSLESAEMIGSVFKQQAPDAYVQVNGETVVDI
ncbi:hypothetical protein NLJ89_g5748 [Agrocybe chaxingu]|uniref:Uncharacterized protein n=1 Tax=Agrocybe chaxingu TaxID=84603 RepID=A0A9W8JXX7_9AGAR|nr:hypothetical protein NLJ89_g5748 [Agrocybe chaxingu]